MRNPGNNTTKAIWVQRYGNINSELVTTYKKKKTQIESNFQLVLNKYVALKPGVDGILN